MPTGLVPRAPAMRLRRAQSGQNHEPWASTSSMVVPRHPGWNLKGRCGGVGACNLTAELITYQQTLSMVQSDAGQATKGAREVLWCCSRKLQYPKGAMLVTTGEQQCNGSSPE